MAQAEKIVKRLIPQIAKEQNLLYYVPKVEPISSGGANYASVLYNITLREGNKTIHMFAKVASMGDQMRSQAPKLYETEIYVYTNLVKIYEKLQDDHKVPKEHRLTFSKFYGHHSTFYEETIVLENLVVAGYQAYDRFKPFSWEYANAAVRELAKMHALSYAYGEYYPEEFNKVMEERKFIFDAVGTLADHFKAMFEKTIEATREENKDKLQRFLDAFKMDMLVEHFMKAHRLVLGHGDFRPSNLMHRNRADGTVDIKIVDLQTLQGASPVIDLLNFIFTGSDEQFRAQYYDKLIDHYYTQLAAAMTRLHLDPNKIYSRADFDQELKEKLPFGLTIAVFSLPVVTVSAEDAPKVNEDMDITSFSVDKTSDLYTERLNGVVNDYVKWGVLK